VRKSYSSRETTSRNVRSSETATVRARTTAVKLLRYKKKKALIEINAFFLYLGSINLIVQGFRTTNDL
jgi:phosphate starvation-inducible membrane PsiE